MKRWLCLALVWVGVCLLLALGHSEAVRGADRHPRIAGWGRSVGPWGEPPSASPPAASATRSSGPTQARAGPFQSLVVPLGLLTEREVGPPWLGTTGQGRPWSTAGLQARPVAQSKGDVRFPQEVPAPAPGTTPKKGVLQQPLTSQGLEQSRAQARRGYRTFPAPPHRTGCAECGEVKNVAKRL